MKKGSGNGRENLGDSEKGMEAFNLLLSVSAHPGKEVDLKSETFCILRKMAMPQCIVGKAH